MVELHTECVIYFTASGLRLVYPEGVSDHSAAFVGTSFTAQWDATQEDHPQ